KRTYESYRYTKSVGCEAVFYLISILNRKYSTLSYRWRNWTVDCLRSRGFGGSIDGGGYYCSLKMVILTTVLSTLIGLIAGIVPAIQAAKLDPVEAIRSK